MPTSRHRRKSARSARFRPGTGDSSLYTSMNSINASAFSVADAVGLSIIPSISPRRMRAGGGARLLYPVQDPNNAVAFPLRRGRGALDDGLDLRRPLIVPAD